MCIFKETLLGGTTKILHNCLNNYTISTVPPKILVACKLFTDFPTFYRMYRYICLKDPAIFWASWIQSIIYHPIPFRSILIIPFYLLTDLQHGLFSSSSSTKTLEENPFSSTHSTCSESSHPNDILQGFHHPIFHTSCFFYLGSEITISSLGYRLPLTRGFTSIKNHRQNYCFVYLIFFPDHPKLSLGPKQPPIQWPGSNVAKMCC